jgi:hypothetical protein
MQHRSGPRRAGVHVDQVNRQTVRDAGAPGRAAACCADTAACHSVNTHPHSFQVPLVVWLSHVCVPQHPAPGEPVVSVCWCYGHASTGDGLLTSPIAHPARAPTHQTLSTGITTTRCWA